MKPPPKILFFGKKDDEYCLKALKFCQNNFVVAYWYLGEPKNIDSFDCDYIISYRSNWIVPDDLLKNANVAAINFHPGSPDYPGTGCVNFALYENSNEYGVTCHYMESKVDTGKIISVKTFPISSADTVATLTSKVYEIQLAQFFEIMGVILNGEQLPESEKQWQRTAFTRRELDELGRITPAMSKNEISRRIRATSYNKWQPILEIYGFKFELKPKQNR